MAQTSKATVRSLYKEERSKLEIVEEDYDGRTRNDITWCVEANVFTEAEHYIIKYRNQTVMAELYVAASMLIEIPAWKDGRR